MKQAAEERKQTASLRKEIQDNLNTTLSDKRGIRQQDSKYINSLRDELNNFYSANKSSILKGGSSYNELKKKQGFLTSEITRSVSIKENGVQLQSYALKTMDPLKKTDVSLSYKKSLATYELPMNDKRRIDYRFKNELGDDVDVDQLTINELDRIAYFSPNKLDDAVGVLPSTRFQTEYVQKKKGAAPVGTDVTRAYSSKNPVGIANTVFSAAVEYPDMNDFFIKQSQAEQALYSSGGPTLSDRMNKTLKEMDEFYIRAGASTKQGFGSIMSLFEQRDGIPGVDVNNPYEYALFQQLYSNLPRDLGMSYDYKTQSNWRASQSLQLQKQNFYFQKAQANKATSLDGLFIQDIKNGNFDGKKASELINAFTAQQESGLGNLVPAKVEFDDNKKTMTVTTNRALFNTDGSPITNKSVADALLAKNPNGGKVIQLPTGGFGITQSITQSVDKSQPGWETRLSSGLDMAEDAIINSSLQNGFDALRQNTGKDILKTLQQ
jgi:hypothetical protein